MMVLGFLVQCDCGQQAMVDTQPELGWVCPRCTDARGGFGDVDIAQAEPACTPVVVRPQQMSLTQAASCVTHQKKMATLADTYAATQPACDHTQARIGAGVCSDCGQIARYPWGGVIPDTAGPDDDYPIGKVQG